MSNDSLASINIDLIIFAVEQEFGRGVGEISPNNFLQFAYICQMRLLNFRPDFPFPKLNIDSLRGWKAEQIYQLIEPRLIGIQREYAEQAGEADPNAPRDDEEDDAFVFESWTEGWLIICYLYCN